MLGLPLYGALLRGGAIPLLLFGGELKISPKDLRVETPVWSEPVGSAATIRFKPFKHSRKELRCGHFGRRGSVSQWMA